MADADETSERVTRLTKLFNAIIRGHRELKSAADGSRFLEALCAQEDASKCVESLIAAKKGLEAVARAFRFSRDSVFLNGPGASVLCYLSAPSLKQLYGGQFLHHLIEHIVEPPTFWNTFVEAHHARILDENATKSFAWLLLELLCARTDDLPDVRSVAERITEDESLISASSLEVRHLGQKIKHVLNTTSSDVADGPGGRHDNDFEDFRKIKILPTPDEFASTAIPFYRRADVIGSLAPAIRGLTHLDNQFRLLREDFLGELRNDFQIATGQKKGRHKLILDGLQFTGVDCGTAARRKRCSIKLLCGNDIPQMPKGASNAVRKQYVLDNKNLLKNQSFGCLISGGMVLAFANVDRDEDLLARSPPVIVLQITEEASFKKVLFASRMSNDLRFVQVDTAVFAYEPILKRLQMMDDVPLQGQLLADEGAVDHGSTNTTPNSIIDSIADGWEHDLKHTLGTRTSVELDAAQAESLIAGLTRTVSLIQGPPGTGKSFIGALIAKIMHDHTPETLLVQTYTNHALDQFLEDLLDIGIPSSSIVRLGNKSTTRTEPLKLSKQQSTYRRDWQTKGMIDDQKSQAEHYHDALNSKLDHFLRFRITGGTMLEYLEFSEFSEYFDAFSVPKDDDGMTHIGRHGKGINRFYLWNRWCKGHNAGIFQEASVRDYPDVWALGADARMSLRARWEKELLDERIAVIATLSFKYNKCQDQLAQLFQDKTAHILSQKRIIGCTTTAAAMYTEVLAKASPQIIIVEEAGEILESHTLTAMTANTKQLVLIGDHKQLRPKIANYSLSIEKGDGYNLNQSLFERLVVAGVPHTTLTRQHRMRPEISSLVRVLTYPELEDAPKTEGRPCLRGFQDNIIFVSHQFPELHADRIADRRDEGAKSSKENEYEVEMILKCVRYLGQQGYGTDHLVILTPYLGQLYRLLRALKEENDPFLNDLDSFELIRAGLLTPAGANVSKRRIRISTIDNYQGEESDIVIVSLTRSNSTGDIGFMASPQRVNVLLSRARNALIMIGNPNTFMNSRKGKEVWTPIMEQLKDAGHVYDGFPVTCEQHPDRKALISVKHQFDEICPDGGCSEPCGKVLNCGIHKCPQRCHLLQDHSKMPCHEIIESRCPQGHNMTRKCYHSAASICSKCETETRRQEERRQRDYKLDQERQAKQQAYAKRLAEVQDEIDHHKRLRKDEADEQGRQHALSQKMQDLVELKNQALRNAKNNTSVPPNAPAHNTLSNPNNESQSASTVQGQSLGDSSNKSDGVGMVETTSKNEGHGNADSNNSPQVWDNSDAKDDWTWQKKYDGAENKALDALMDMIGLESVKQQFLTIKSKVDTMVRQNVSLQDERFGAALLGNPGTGKTTVARLYAKFLVEVGALPGSHFLETSGSSLANDGVDACKAHIDKILEEGGGVFFIDEAYQLVSGNSYGGKAVLDYLLAEIENLTGKIVFVLAGYHKQMEAFFSHNPGIPSRIPKQLEFKDYNDQELQRILCHNIEAKYKGGMEVEDGMRGLYVRIVSRRIGSSRGRDGFGNAREVQNRLAQISERQATRLRKERRAGLKPDDNIMTKEDLIGPEPLSVLQNNASWAKLQKLIGLRDVKNSVQVLLDGLQFNYQRELEEKPIVEYSLNKCFIGSPGTGKTSVAKLYGRILADIGLLSNGEVVTKNPADFVGSVLGGSEANTKAILASTVGKVLIIDEAYMLASGVGGAGADPYKAAVIDTIVAEVQSTPGEDRCVLLLGYKDQMEEMFRDVNPGLARRFPLDSAFVFEDFDDEEIGRILDLKLKDVGFEVTDQAKQVAMDVLKRARNQPNFGNAGEIDIILDRAKGRHQKHLSSGKVKKVDTFEAIDFDPDFDRGERAATNLPLLFQDVVGCEDLIRQFQGYQTVAANAKAFGMDPREQVPFNFLFRGPPGTGKTTTAQKMGKVFYDMGLLAQAKVEECSATDMIGQYVGQTGPKVQKLMEKALGKVLFIDEAYRLAEGGFAMEAMDELVDCLTKPKFAQKLVTILAGYDEDMNRLMTINPGLTSRFPESVIFHHMKTEFCLELLTKVLSDLQQRKKLPLDLSVLQPPCTQFKDQMLLLFEHLSRLRSWGNARDVKTLAKSMFGKLLRLAQQPVSSLVLTESIVVGEMEVMLAERSHRNEAVGTTRNPLQAPSQTMPEMPLQDTAGSHEYATATNPIAQQCPEIDVEESRQRPKTTSPDGLDDPHGSGRDCRDSGVSNEVWNQLQLDKQAAIDREKEYQNLQKERLEEEQRVEELKRSERAAADEEERRQREAERIQFEMERRKRDEILAALGREQEKERQAQKKLRQLGACPIGFAWIKQGQGYRCAGGSHFMTDAELGL